MEQFAKVEGPTWRVLSGACDLLFTPRPLGPLYDISVQVGGRLPELLESGVDRALLFSACLQELSAEPTILIVEDIHWADQATLDLLKYLGRRIRRTSALMILTYRDDELGGDSPLRLLLGDLASSPAVQRITVSGLSVGAVVELAGDRPIDAVAVHHLTNGNPFFVTEILAVQSGVPQTVRDAVLARAARLPARARRLLEAAAVVGARAEAWLLMTICNQDAAAAEECISAGMLQAQDDSYAFRHELARQTILASILPERKAELHRLLLARLKESPQTRDDLARLANHAEGGRDANAVLEYAAAAARQASALGAHREAAAHYRAALDYAAAYAAEVRAGLLDAYADECSLLNQMTQAKEAQEQALLLWRELGQREKEGRAFRRLSEIDHDVLLGSSREENIASAIRLLETLPPSAELARAYAHMGRIHLSLNAASGRDPAYWGSRALELAEKLGDTETMIHALDTIGVWGITIGEAEGRAQMERSLQLALEHGIQFQVARAFTNLANELEMRLELPAALHYANAGLEYCIQNDLDQWRLELLHIRAEIRFHQGDWDGSDQDFQEALKISSDTEFFNVLGSRILRLRIQARRGDPLSLADLELARTLLPNIHDINTRCAMASILSEIAWLKGDLAGCREASEAVFREALEFGDEPALPIDLAELTYWAWRAGAISEAPPSRLEPYATQVAGNWREAASMWEKLGCPYEQATALMDGDEAAQLAALSIFDRLGARPMIERLKRQMRTRGMRKIPRGPRPATRQNRYGLTGREVEVLACLARGSNNPAIARELSLSTRTVEHHIASILQKMSVESRIQAAALALKERLLPSE